MSLAEFLIKNNYYYSIHDVGRSGRSRKFFVFLRFILCYCDHYGKYPIFCCFPGSQYWQAQLKIAQNLIRGYVYKVIRIQTYFFRFLMIHLKMTNHSDFERDNMDHQFPTIFYLESNNTTEQISGHEWFLEIFPYIIEGCWRTMVPQSNFPKCRFQGEGKG